MGLMTEHVPVRSESLLGQHFGHPPWLGRSLSGEQTSRGGLQRDRGQLLQGAVSARGPCRCPRSAAEDDVADREVSDDDVGVPGRRGTPWRRTRARGISRAAGPAPAPVPSSAGGAEMILQVSMVSCWNARSWPSPRGSSRSRWGAWPALATGGCSA